MQNITGHFKSSLIKMSAKEKSTSTTQISACKSTGTSIHSLKNCNKKCA